MQSSKTWGLITYEQDWLVKEFREMEVGEMVSVSFKVDLLNFKKYSR